jgi:NADH-quinone oxidoreductase subunit N
MNAPILGSSELLALLPIILLSLSAIVVLLAIAIRRSHDWSYRLSLGGLAAALAGIWPATSVVPSPVTGLLTVDGYALFFIGLCCVIGIVVAILARPYLRHRSDVPEEFYLLLLTALLGAAVLSASAHFASFFLGLETLSISLFPLIAYTTREPRALEAAMKYLVLSGVASGFLLFGMALVYAATGTLTFDGTAPDMALVTLLGMLLLLVGVGFKLSFWPFHLWTADVYQGAPTPVTALLATVSKAAMFAVLLRYGLDSALVRLPMAETALGVLAAGSILVGNLAALAQQSLKRLLAFSSIAHMGYLLFAVIAAHRAGAALASEALVFYVTAYTLTTVTAFGVIAVRASPGREADELIDYAGLIWVRPGLAGVLLVSLLSLAGIPLTAGFVAKFYLFAVASDAGLWTLLGLLIIGSGIGMYYYLRVVFELIRAPQRPDGAAVPDGSQTGGSGMLMLLALTIIGLGLWPSGLIGLLAGVTLR